MIDVLEELKKRAERAEKREDDLRTMLFDLDRRSNEARECMCELYRSIGMSQAYRDAIAHMSPPIMQGFTHEGQSESLSS